MSQTLTLLHFKPSRRGHIPIKDNCWSKCAHSYGFPIIISSICSPLQPPPPPLPIVSRWSLCMWAKMGRALNNHHTEVDTYQYPIAGRYHHPNVSTHRSPLQTSYSLFYTLFTQFPKQNWGNHTLLHVYYWLTLCTTHWVCMYVQGTACCVCVCVCV